VTLPIVPPAPRIAVLALGGTIGAPVDEKGSNSTLRVDADALVASLGLSDEAVRLEPETFRQVMSADIGWNDVVALAARVRELVVDGVDGIVLTQGTDTLEETAYLLDLFVDAPVPVVVTGAMRNPGRAGADGPANLGDAIRCASEARLAAAGVVVVLAGEIHRAASVRKTHTSALGAFVSPGAGPIGAVTEGRVLLFALSSMRRPALMPASDSAPRVALHRLSLGDDTAVLDALPRLGYDGLVVEVFGAGHVGVRALDALTRAVETMPVVFCSRTGSGALYRSTGDYPGSEGDLLRRGLIPADCTDGLKARLLLMALVAAGETDRGRIAAAFDIEYH
jgi:L-asparaginase